MTDRQDAVVSMYQEVTRFFMSNATKVAKDEILKKHSDGFHIDVLEIARYMQAQEFNSKGFAAKKKKEKIALSDFIFKLSSGFCSFGVDTDNQPIVEEFDISESSIFKKNDAEFVNHANRLIASLGEHIKALAPYHITADELVNLTKETQAYSELLHVPDEVIKDKAIATEKLKELITKCYNTLDNSIDKDMVYYEEKDEPFYLEYQKRREIYDADTHALSIHGTVEDADSDCDGDCELEYVKVTVKFKAGAELADSVKSTSKKGNYQFDKLQEGMCTVTFEKNYYDTLVVDSEVHHNRATKLDVKMKKTIKL